MSDDSAPWICPTYEQLDQARKASRILVVTLNRPEVANAINTQMGRDLLDLWTRLTRSRGDLRCVVLTGAGDRVSAPAAT